MNSMLNIHLIKPKRADIFLHDRKVGRLERNPNGYRFQYDLNYLDLPDAKPVSLTFPLSDKPYENDALFPFFIGLLPEGWFLDITCRVLKIDPANTFDLLLATCADCIGAVSVIPVNEEGRS